MVEVTVVVPTRNRAAMLRQALGSVAAQRGVDLEAVVVDDGMPPHPWVECRTENNRAHGSIECNVAG